MTQPTILILGAGARIGASLAAKFSHEGYKVATAARTAQTSTSDLSVKADFADPASIKSVFDEVNTKLGVPSVVVYNAGSVKATPANDTLSIPFDDYTNSMNVGVNSAFLAAQQAVLGFAKLPVNVQKTFIFTGNCMNTSVITPLLVLGMQKSAAAHMIQAAAQSYADKGYQFYYGDERTAEGKPMLSGVTGEGHAEFYWQLTQRKEQGPWDATFVSGEGYVDFAAR